MLRRSPLTAFALAALVAVATPALAASQPFQKLQPWIGTEEAKLVASDAADGDHFGAVAVYGDTAVVGVALDDHAGGVDAGSAYVFVRGGTTWTEQAKLTASDAALGDNFGIAVAIHGDTLVVGAWADEHSGVSHAGSAYVFVRNGTTWTEQAKLVASDPSTWASLGYAVAVSDDTAMVGAPFVSHGNTPSPVYVFVRNGTTWSEQQKLLSSDQRNYFGFSIALSGDTAVIGAAAAAYAFVRNGTSWSEQQKLTPSNPGDEFGLSVAMFGDTAVVGDPGGDITNPTPGSSHVFVRNGTSWSEQQELVASDAAPNDYFGAFVAMSGDTIVVGAAYDDHAGGADAGSAYVFARSGATWSEQQKLTASDAAAADVFGASGGISGDTVLIGAVLDDHAGGTDAGSAYAFRLSPAPAVSYCTAGTSASGCQALLSASGTPSASAPNGFALHAGAVEGAVDGVFFWGTSGRQANPWGNGTSFQCVVPPLVRAGLQAGGGTSGACDGSFTLDLNALWCPTCPKPQKNPGAGAVVQAQLWYADPLSTSNQPASLSDALEFSLEP